jgi:hypothetical protein
MPDKFHATGTVDIEVLVSLQGVQVEGYGQTAEEARKNARDDIEEEIGGRGGYGDWSAFTAAYNMANDFSFDKVRVSDVGDIQTANIEPGPEIESLPEDYR